MGSRDYLAIEDVMTYQLHHGNCIDIMPLIERESVDAIVTDPPYGLGFMGRDWDHGVPGEHFWREAYRCVKPGAYLLAFGGTRTFHRLAVAIEDAGWEIRDTICWIYGSGFPKSHNFGCKCRGSAVQYTHEEDTDDQSDLQNLREEILEAPMLGEEKQGSLLLAQMQRDREVEASKEVQREHEGTREEGQEIRRGESSMEGRGNVLEETRQLQADQIREMPAGISTDGASRRLHHGTSSYNGASFGPDARENGSNTPQESRSARQQDREPRIIPQQQRPQEIGMGDEEICEVCGGLKNWKGFGTALKPAFEPIIVARKPLQGTVAENVQRYGTGAMNIDACRIAWQSESDKENGRPASFSKAHDGFEGKAFAIADRSHRSPIDEQPSQGRWPANLIHDGSAEVLAGFPMTTSGAWRNVVNRPTSGYSKGAEWSRVRDDRDGDTGSAARFFYCAKASKADRDEGLEDLQLRDASIGDQRPSGSMSQRIHSDEGRPDTLARNFHPTVKPTSLMRYLCRLVTPPNGTILDPFMGSGSTGKAAMLEGFHFIGIDTEIEYVEIAARRIEHACEKVGIVIEQPMMFETQRETIDKPKQLILL